MTRVSLLVLLAFSACASDAGPRVDGPIERTSEGGFNGRGDGTKLRIELDGSAQITDATGAVTSLALETQALETILDAVQEARLDTLEPHYSSCADGLVDHVEVQLEGRLVEVRVDECALQDATAPVRLRKLINVLDQLDP